MKNRYLKIANLGVKAKLLDIDKNNNLYFFDSNGIYKLKLDLKSTIVKIEPINNKIDDVRIFIIDESYNKIDIYFVTEQVIIFNGVWIGAIYEHFVLRPNETIARKIENINGEVYNITKTAGGNIFIYADGGCCILKENSTQATRIKTVGKDILYLPIYDSFKETVYLYEKDDVFIIKGNENFVDELFCITNDLFCFFLNDAEHNIIFITKKGGEYALKSDEITSNKAFNIVNGIKAINSDFNNSFYIGTKQGAYWVPSGQWIAKKIDEISGEVHQISRATNGDLYFCSSTDGLYLLKFNQSKVFKISDQNHFAIYDIIIAPNNDTYLSTTRELMVLKNGATTAIAIPKTRNLFL